MATATMKPTNTPTSAGTRDPEKRKRSVTTQPAIPSRQSKRMRVKKGSSEPSAGALFQSDSASDTGSVGASSNQLRLSRPSAHFETEKEKLERIATMLVQVHAGLTRCKNGQGLSPSPKTNQLFTKLVVTGIEIVSEALESRILADARVRKVKDDLRQYASDGEGLLEAFHAKRMLEELEQNLQSESSLSPPQRWKVLESFPYYQNYIELTRMEKSIIDSLFDIGRAPERYVFIGSGPMPLTAICLAHLIDVERRRFAARLQFPSSSYFPPSPTELSSADESTPCSSAVRIHNIDYDQEAINLSRSLAKKVDGPLRSLTFECRAAENTPMKAYKDYDVVYLAALVGSTVEQKIEITREVLSNMKEGSLLILRSAHNLRKLLYEPVDLALLKEIRTEAGLGLDVVRVVHPTDGVVNSVVVCRVMNTKRLVK